MKIISINRKQFEGKVYNIELKSNNNNILNDDLFWIDGETNIKVHNCFPKDVEALYRTSTDQAYDFRLLRGVMDVNEMQKIYFVNKIRRYL